MTLALDPIFDRRAQRASRVVWLIGGAVLAFLLWASVAWLGEIVRAEGSVVSSSRPQIISNLEGGILAELSVQEGDVVQRGQTLARLYGTQYQAAVDDLRDQIATLDIRRLRLEAEALGAVSFDAPEDLAQRVPQIVASESSLLSARVSDYAAARDGAEAVLKQANQELDILDKHRTAFDADIPSIVASERRRGQGR